MHKPNRIIVIGGNAAGPSAAAKAKRTNPDAEVLLFESSNYISTGTCELPYLFSNEITDHNKIIFFTADEFWNEKGVRVFNNHFVKEISNKYKEINVLDKKTNTVKDFEYDKLILTTGSTARQIDDLPYHLENVFSLKSVTDYLKIQSYLTNNTIRKILIIGSGYIGLEIADSFAKTGYEVTLYEKEKMPMPAADNEVQYLIHDLISKSNISFLSGDNSTGFVIKDNGLKQFKFMGRFIDFDMVIVSVGVKPNTFLAENIGLKIGMKGGIIVDNRLKTSNPDIFAAGDVIEIKNFITKQYDYLPLATHAHSHGHIAGENAAGGNIIAEPVIPNSVFKFRDNFIVQVGLNQRQAEEYSVNVKSVTAVANNKVKVMPNSRKVFGKILFDKYSGLILGASFVGGEEVAGYADIISTMIYNKVKGPNLAKVNYNYSPPVSPFVNILSILGRKIKEKI